MGVAVTGTQPMTRGYEAEEEEDKLLPGEEALFDGEVDGAV